MLALKLLLTPLLVGVVSLAGRRWGPAVSGWLVGLPLTSGPVALFLALDLGTAFSAHAAQGTLLGLISLAAFSLVYSWLSFRAGWLYCLLISWATYFISTFALEGVSLPLALMFVGVVAILVAVLVLLPHGQDQAIVMKSPRWELPLRMMVATVFVLALTGASNLLGPQLSGLLAPFPLYATILAVFTHHFQDAASARRVLRGVITGVFSFAVFFLIIAALSERLGIAATFSLATLAALTMHGVSLYIITRWREQRL